MKHLPKLNNRDHLIDLMRFLAASWVAIFHFNASVPHINNWYRNFMGIGYLGVPVFFVISGYCIQIAANHAKTASEFITRRLTRIFIPYWFSLLLVVFVAIALKIIYGANFITVFPKKVIDIVSTIGLFTSPVTTIPTINWVYWTLSYEVFFYTIVFTGLLLSLRYRLLWLIAITIASIFIPKHNFWLLFFLQYWPNFCLGLVLYRLLHNTKEHVWLNILLFFATLASFYYSKQDPYYIIICFITFTLIIINHYKPINDNLFSRLGNYSYSLYLLHVPVGGYLLGFVKQMKIVQTNIWLNITWDILLLTIMVYLAKLMYTYIELPSIALGKKLSRKPVKISVKH